MRSIQLTTSEWQSLQQIKISSENAIPGAHRAKFMLLGIAAEKAGKLVVTFEGRLQLREYDRIAP